MTSFCSNDRTLGDPFVTAICRDSENLKTVFRGSSNPIQQNTVI
jgi:hypothetical protein